MHPVDRPSRPLCPAALALGWSLAVAALPVAAQTSPAFDLLRRAPDADTRSRAAEALGRLRPPGARAALEAALDDRAPAVRVASAQALEALGETAATTALNRHALDPDVGPRDAVMRALQGLLRRMPATVAGAWSPSARGSPAVAPTLSPAALSATPPARVNWRRVRVLLTLGPLVNNVSGDAGPMQYLREALRTTVSEDERFAMHPGALPSSVASRVRHGDVRAYSLEGSLTALRETSSGPTLAVRAEVSLVLVAEPSHVMAATLSGTATAQEPRPVLPDLPDPMPLLRRRAIEGAAHGALRSLETQLLPARGGR